MTIDSAIIQEVKKVLKGFGDTYLLDTGALNRSKLIEDLDKYTPILMKELLASPLIEKTYTEAIGDITIFKLNQFIEMFTYKEYWEDSYTKYSNKIGLTAGGKFIDETADVVLDFPFKDTVLKAGMTKEDDKDANEPFLNEVIAKSEIDTLFEPKIFVNTRKYDTENPDGKPVSSFSGDDNLIIKGNNLIALHSIKARYAGKVKLIYVDVPYNTGADSFKYNDRFNRSAWLTFIKNRFEVARELLSDDGVILTQISFHEYPYLRVLLDSFLGKENHQFDMNVLVRHPARALTADKPFNDVVEYTLIYSKNPNFIMPKIEQEKTVDKYIYKVQVSEKPSETRILGNKSVEIYLPEQVQIIKQKQGAENQLHRETIRGSIREKNSSGRFYVANLENLRSEFSAGTIFKVSDMGDDSLGFRYFELPKSGVKNGAYYQGMPLSSSVTRKPYPNFVDFVKEYNSVNKEGIYEFRNGKKPEKFVKYYLDMFTKENDIVLDFFMGSATTQAVAMKMKRRFIGIEQMDYINTVAVPRLEQVIAGEQSGISELVEWQGGGSFVYAELFEKNQFYAKAVSAASTDLELLSALTEMQDAGGDFDFHVNINDFKSLLATADLTFAEKQQLALKVIDKNQLYYQYSEIEDEEILSLVDQKDYKFNKTFYEGKNAD